MLPPNIFQKKCVPPTPFVFPKWFIATPTKGAKYSMPPPHPADIPVNLSLPNWSPLRDAGSKNTTPITRLSVGVARVWKDHTHYQNRVFLSGIGIIIFLVMGVFCDQRSIGNFYKDEYFIIKFNFVSLPCF